MGQGFIIVPTLGKLLGLIKKMKKDAFSAITLKFQKVITGNLVDRFPMKGATTAQSTSFRLQKKGLSSHIYQKIFKTKTRNSCHIKHQF